MTCCCEADKNRIIIVRGNDTNFNDIPFLTLHLTSDAWDLTTMRATLTLGGITKEFNDLSSGYIYPSYTAEETATFPFGNLDGVLEIYNADEQVATVESLLPFKVISVVHGDAIAVEQFNYTINVEQGGQNVMNIEVTTGFSVEVVGTVTLPAGQPARVENVGTADRLKLVFYIPKGIDGSGAVNDVEVNGESVLGLDGIARIDTDTLEVKATGTTTERTLADRFADVVNVKDFGAVGDGVTDDTVAIQAAIDSTHHANTGIRDVVFFPAGKYKVSTITISNGQSVVLSNPTLISDDVALTIDNAYAGTIIEYGNITARNCGIWIKRGKAVHIEHTRIDITHEYAESSSVYGIHIGGVDGLYAGNENIISDCSIYATNYIDSYGLYNQADDNQFNNLIVYNFKYGIRDSGGSNSYSQIHGWCNGYSGGTEAERITSLTNSACLYTYKDITIQSMYADSYQYGVLITDTNGDFQHKIDGLLIYHGSGWPATLPIYALYCGTTYHPNSILLSNLDMNNLGSAEQRFSTASTGYRYVPSFYYGNPQNSSVVNMPNYTTSLIGNVGVGVANEIKLNAVENDSSVGWLGFYKFSTGAMVGRINLPANDSFNETFVRLEQTAGGGAFTTPNVRPQTDNTYNLGSESYRWSSIYSATPAQSNIGNIVPTTEWVDTNSTNRLNGIRTNCLVDVPQDINLQLSSGTLTLKSGSVITGADGTQVQTTADKTRTSTTTGKLVAFLDMSASSGGMVVVLQDQCYSGTTQPTEFTGAAVWFDTANMDIKYTTDGGSTWASNYSFPLGVVTCDGSSITSIDQVFNGIGYMGNSVYVLPDVKYLVPAGRNADGTDKNTEVTTGGVFISGNNNEDRKSVYMYDTQYINRITDTSTTGYYYDYENNYYRRIVDNTIVNVCFVASLKTTANHIESMDKRQAFQSVDYYDLKRVSDSAVNDVRLESGSNSIVTNGVAVIPYSRGVTFGVVRGGGFGVNTNNGILQIVGATNAQIDDRANNLFAPITCKNFDYILSKSIVSNTQTLDDSGKANARSWIGAEQATIIATLTGTDSITLADNTIYNDGGNDEESLTIAQPTTYDVSFISSLMFNSGSTATVFSASFIYCWGDDCSAGVFTPIANRRYTLIVYYDGVAFRGIVKGF